MRILFYSIKDFEHPYLLEANKKNFPVKMTESALGTETASFAEGFTVVSIFTGDDASAPVIKKLKEVNVKYIAIRAAGYDNVDLQAAKENAIQVANVPAYSPYSIAEHALALLFAMNRKLILANDQVHHRNFKMNNLIGYDLHGKTIGIIGTGNIGGTLLKILNGFNCKLLAYDIRRNDDLVTNYNANYVSLEQLCRESDIISIHTPLNEQTKYLINKNLISIMKKGVMLINTGRGACVNTTDVLHYLESGHIGYFGADVYEKERGLFFHDWTGKALNDDLLKRLLMLPNVLITPHQAFATKEALGNIAETTFYNIECWAAGRCSDNELYKPAINYSSLAATNNL
ncbi:MAG: 2-hydroxyacid dehydrogenase [Bacteroidetes bacterium]|nr:2-hydroxyacid dehydrogenase [Bacteroidota bacterium]